MNRNKAMALFKRFRLPLTVGAMLLIGLCLVLLPGGETKRSETLTYASELEARIASLVDTVCGKSGSRVLLTTENGGESVYAMQNLVDRKAPEIRGVAVICQGGDDPTLQKKITELIEAVTGAKSHRIRVCGMGKGDHKEY